MRLRVWYDGACPLCRREIALMRKLDWRKHIAFINIAPADSADLCPISRAEMLARFHVEEKGKLLSGAAAFAALWRALPLLMPLGHIARLPFVLGGLEKLYGLFLRYRPRLIQWLG